MMDLKNFNSVTPTDIWGAYRDSEAYLQNVGLFDNVPRFVDYYEGRQWPTPTARTKTLPRPTVNITKFISRNIKSGIVNVPVKIIFQAENKEDTRDLNAWHEYIEGELKMRSVDRRNVLSGVKKGTYVYHYYWDNNKKGKDASITGGVNVETIDMLNLRVANPKETDEQKQKWIMIISRVELDTVKEIAEDPKNVLPDSLESAYQEEEQQGTEYVTVVTLYFRVNGQVYFLKATKDAIIQKARMLKPDVEAALKEIHGAVDPADAPIPEGEKKETEAYDKFDTYPVVVGVFEDRENSIYGIGAVEEMLENQNIINRDLAYYIKARRDMSLGGWMKKKGALAEGQSITNSPDQVLTDNTPGNSWGIKRLDVGNIPNDNLNFSSLFLDMIRTVTGTTEVMSGEVLGKNMSGAAISLLQGQAQIPLEDYRSAFWTVKEKQAQVLLNFYRFYYNKQTFKTKRREEGKVQDVEVEFDPSKVRGQKFDVIAVAGQGAAYNELTTVTALDKMMEKGVITPKFYITAMPDKVLGNKDDLLDFLNEQEQGQMAQLMAQNQQMQQQLIQAAEVIAKQTESVNQASQLVNENNRLNQLILKMATEFQTIMQQAENTIKTMGLQAQKYQEDATLFAQEYAKTQGGIKNEKVT